MDSSSRGALDRQQLRLRDRQKFFEEVFQQDSEFFFPLSHLHLESRRPPIGSISSMEVNVDTLEQAELIDFGDQDASDVFLPCDELPQTPQTPTLSGVGEHPKEQNLQMPPSDRTMSRTSSSSSSTELNSPDLNGDGADTPLAQSDEEEDGSAEPAACS